MRLSRFLLVLALLLCGARPGQAGELLVPGDYPDIQSALAAAAAGDVVIVAPGTYPIQSLRLQSNIGVVGSGQSATSLEGGVSELDTGSELRNLTLRASSFQIGGGHAPTIADCTITGDGVYVFEASPTFQRCTIFDTGLGVIIDGPGRTVLDSCDISESRGYGVTISSSSALVRNCTVSRNAEGGVFWYGDAGNCKTCVIMYNRGPGLMAFEARIQLSDCTIAQNSGEGVVLHDSSLGTLLNCTISGNLKAGVTAWQGSAPKLVNCIVWDNIGGSVGTPAGNIVASYCCLEASDAIAGAGNIHDDPLFCGWADAEVSVATQEQLDSALGGYRYSLATGSPCLSAGEGGADMGAANGVCAEPGARAVAIRLEPGSFSAGRWTLAHHVSMTSGGVEAAQVAGEIRGLRTGALLAELSVAAGCIRVDGSESPQIQGCRVSGNATDSGVLCLDSASPVLLDCQIVGNRVGVQSEGDSWPELTDCRITANAEAGALCLGGGGTVPGLHLRKEWRLGRGVPRERSGVRRLPVRREWRSGRDVPLWRLAQPCGVYRLQQRARPDSLG